MSVAPVPAKFGSWEDAEALRRWSFQRRSPEQRLAWLIDALEIAYRSGALRTPAPLASNTPTPPAQFPTPSRPGSTR